MKIKKITYKEFKFPGLQGHSMLTSRCDTYKDGTLVGSVECHKCPLFRLQFRNYIICSTPKIKIIKYAKQLICPSCGVELGVSLLATKKRSDK